MYTIIVNIINKRFLKNKTDTVWKEKLWIDEKTEPVWRVFKPPLDKMTRDLQVERFAWGYSS